MRAAADQVEHRHIPAGDSARLFESISDGLAICRHGVVIWATARADALLATGEPLVGSAIEDRLVDVGHGTPGGGRACEVECGIAGADDRRRVRVRVIASSELEPGSAFYVLTECSHEDRLHAELLRTGRLLHDANRERVVLREQLEEAASDRAELFNVVSHELRTPLTVISGYNKLLLGEEAGALNAAQSEFLTESDKSCRRLEAFLKNLLEASHEASVANGLDAKPNDIHATITAVAGFLRPILDERGIMVERGFDDTPCWARFDPSRVEQVLTNLLSNASRYSKPGGSVRIKTGRIVAAGHAHVEVSVIDRGPGVAPVDRERIFDPYVRASSEGRAGGLGLGLAICKRIIDAHGGSILVCDEPGGGSRFSFTLPTAAGPESEAS